MFLTEEKTLGKIEGQEIDLSKLTNSESRNLNKMMRVYNTSDKIY